MSRPPILLVHGQATGAWMWNKWREHLGALGWEVIVLDLRGHGLSMPADLASVTLEDYVADIASVAPQIEAARGRPPIIGGWQMGALLAMMYAASGGVTPGLLLFSPILPLEAGGKASIETVRAYRGDLLGPEAFGLFPEDAALSLDALTGLEPGEIEELLSRTADERESGVAFRQALRGVSVPGEGLSLPVLSLLAGSERKVGVDLSDYLQAETAYVPGGSWSMVQNERTVVDAAKVVAAWLTENFDETREV